MQNIELLPIILGSPGSQQFYLFRHAQMMCLKTACNFSQDPLASPHLEVSDVSWMFAEFDSDNELPSWAPVDLLGSP